MIIFGCSNPLLPEEDILNNTIWNKQHSTETIVLHFEQNTCSILIVGLTVSEYTFTYSVEKFKNPYRDNLYYYTITLTNETDTLRFDSYFKREYFMDFISHNTNKEVYHLLYGEYVRIE